MCKLTDVLPEFEMTLKEFIEYRVTGGTDKLSYIFDFSSEQEGLIHSYLTDCLIKKLQELDLIEKEIK